MGTTYIAGLDLGQARDYTALTILERTPHPEGGRRGAHYDVRHLQRWPLGTGYPVITGEVQAVMERLRATAGRAALVVDKTGVGAPVVDLLHSQGCRGIVPITITGGQEVVKDGHAYRVPKRDLVSVLGVLLPGGRLRIAQALPEAQTLVDELEHFRVRIGLSGHDAYGADEASWRDGPHDDLVLAVALAAWYGEAAPRPAGGKVIVRRVKCRPPAGSWRW